MALLIGFAGTSIGFILASVCPTETQAVLLAIGLLFPNLMFAGMLWPIQSMPMSLQYFSYLLPCTLTGYVF
jgi:ABC-2 type transport system permease protein